MIAKVKLNKNTKEPMPLIAMRGVVLFPNNVTQFDVGRKKSIAAVEYAAQNDTPIMFVTQRDISVDNPGADDLYRYGVIGTVRQVLRISEDYMKVLVAIQSRARLIDVIEGEDFLRCKASKAPVKRLREEDNERIDAVARAVRKQLETYVEYYPKLSSEIFLKANGGIKLEHLADFLADNLVFGYDDKQQVLECSDSLKKLELFLSIITKENNVLKYEKEIDEKVRAGIDRHQRDYVLREQMQAISEELGLSDEDTNAEASEYTKKIKALELIPDSEEKLLREVERLRRMQSGSQEASVIRSYLDYCLELPWNKESKDVFDLSAAKKKLDSDHYGLEKVKERIIELLAVRSATNEPGSQILCLVGPPGVGKTSIARSIAQCMGRKYVRIALGGIRDENEIRGHRRTYLGSMPGRIISALIQAKTVNPLILLDEIDKLGSDYRGDPSAALLEALDPEQNFDFTDHFIDIPFDLSKVLFITTANDPSAIPAPLYDRMEIIELTSYTRQEKFFIAKKHLLPRELKRHGLDKKRLSVEYKALFSIIDEYTSEAGVRELERMLAKLCRKSLTKLQGNELESCLVTKNNLADYLGVPIIKPSVFSRVDQVGVCNGLAWTAVGGVIMPIEVVATKGTGKLEITGSLGDVMVESAKIAFTNANLISEKYGFAADALQKLDIHIHAPEGAVKKDGPSAGVTLVTALVSAITGREVRSNIAMTGEITLTGKVLPIGGLKEKLLAAEKEGIKRVLIPKDNLCDVKEIDPKSIKKLTIEAVETVSEVLEKALLVPKKAAKQLLIPEPISKPQAKAKTIKS